MFNHGNRGRRAGDNSGITGLSAAYIEARSPQVTISSYQVLGSDDRGLDTAGGQTIVVTGGGFATGITGTIGGVSIGAITYVSPTQITFTSPAKSGGLYVLVLTNTNGNTGALVPGIVYSSAPAFSTPAGSLGSAYETTSYSKTVSASSDSAITYTLSSGSLPTGATLDPSAGTITGTLGAIPSGSTTYSFSITATDAELQDVTRSFTITASTDVLNWIAPSNGATIVLDGSSYSQPLSAPAGSGSAVTYTANTLPTGLTLSAGTISGTPTVEGTTSTLLTATATSTTRTQTNNITWVVALGDQFWNTVPLLTGASTVTPFINDASLNNNQLTIAGDAKPTSFTPYGDGYFSYKFDGASYALGSTPTNNTFYGVTIGTRDFCLEGWGFWTSFNFGTYGAPLISILGQTAGELMIRANKTSANTTSANFFSILGASTYIPSSMFSSGVSVGTLYLNRWHHLAIQRVSGTWYFYVDGVMLNSTSAGDASLSLAFTKFYIGSDAAGGGGYMAGNASNIRLSVGTVPYATAGFTVPTSPLPYLPTTKFLSAQSNRLIDNGPINTTFTTGGTANTGVQITPFSPFAQSSTMSVPTLYSTHFDGTSGYISTAHNSQLSMDSGNFSAECWCYRTCSVSGETATLINKSGTGFVSVPHWIFGTTNGYWSYGIGTSGTSGTTIFSTTTTTLLVPDTWHHVAFIKTGTTYSLFLNGTRISTTTNATVPLDNNPLGLSIGFQLAQTSTSYWWGQISDVRINKGTLPTGYDATQTTITVPTAKLTAVTGTVLLTCQDSTLKDNSTNNFPMSSVAPARPHPVSPFTQTYSSSTGLTTLGSSYFDGTGDYLSAPALLVNNLSGTWTVEAWCYMTQAPTGNAYNTSFPILTAEDGAGTMAHYWGVGSTAFVCMVRDGSGYDTITGTMPGTNQWFHIAVTNVGTTVSFYLNGVLAGSKTQTAATWNSTSATVRANIGALYTYNYAKGYIADLRINNGSALYTSNFLPTYQPLSVTTNTQLLTLQYNGGANNYGIVDASGWLNPLTRLGNATQGTFSPYSPNGWSTYFNGTTDYVSLPAAFNTSFAGLAGNKIQIEMWVYPTNTAATSYAVGLFGTYAAVGANGRWYFGIDTNMTLVFVYTTSTGSQNNVNATATCVANKWQHIAVTVDATTSASSTISFYYNGTASTVSTGNNMSTQATSYSAPQISVNSSYISLYTGYISNMRVTKNNFTITGAYTVPTAPLTTTSGDTLFLSFQSNKIIDNSAYTLALTFAGVPSVQAFSPFGGVTVTPSSYSLKLDGTSGTYATFTGKSSLALGTGDFTIESWVYRTSSVGGGGSVDGWYTGTRSPTASGGLGIKIQNNGVLAWNTSSAYGTGTIAIALNTWAHIAVTRQSGTLKWYINGVLDYTTSLPDNFSNPTAAIGITDDPYYSTLIISNFRLITGTAIYTSNFTPPTAPLTAVTNTALLTCTGNILQDYSLVPATVSQYGIATKMIPFNPFGQTVTNNVAYNPSIHSGSLYLDGTGDYLTAPNSKSFDLSTGQWTIECWFYQLAAKQVQLFSISAASWRLAVSTDGSAGFTFNTSSTTSYPAGSFPPGQWHHISASFNADGTTAAQRSHANGKLIGTGQYWPNADTTSLFYIGNNKDAAGAWDFNGYITDIRITKGQCLYTSSFFPNTTALPLTTNTAFLVNGTSAGIIDQHSSNVFETVGNAQIANEDPYQGNYYSGYFNGSTSNIALTPGTFGANDFTIEFFVNVNVSTGVVIFNNWRWYNGLTPGSLAIYVDSTGIIYANVYTGGGNVYDGAPTTTVVLQTSFTNYLYKWTHVALCRQGANVYLAINGSIAISSTLTSNTALNLETQRTGYNIGAWNVNQGGPAFAMSGYISNFRIIKGSALYTGSYTVPTSPLSASGSSLLTFNTNKIVDASSNNLALTNTAVMAKSVNPFQQNTGKSIYFDGTGDYLQFPETPGTWLLGSSDFTIESWVYVSVTNASEAYIIARSQHGVGSDYFLGLSSSNQLKLYMSTGGANIVTSTGTLKVGDWTHVAATRSGTTFRLFINGVLDGTITSSVVLGTSYGPTVVGNSSNNTGSHYLNGYLKDLRITKGVARYTATFTPPTLPFKGK